MRTATTEEVIDLRELRIGNLLEYKGQLVSVSCLTLDIDDEYNETIGFVIYGTSSNEHADWNRALALDLKRISLTPEWLERCGFAGSGQFVNGTVEVEGGGDVQIRVIEDEKCKYYIPFNKSIKIEYIHQLQNLYFALTGEALQIKL